jgi:hypothetical protein
MTHYENAAQLLGEIHSLGEREHSDTAEIAPIVGTLAGAYASLAVADAITALTEALTRQPVQLTTDLNVSGDPGPGAVAPTGGARRAMTDLSGLNELVGQLREAQYERDEFADLVQRARLLLDARGLDITADEEQWFADASAWLSRGDPDYLNEAPTPQQVSEAGARQAERWSETLRLLGDGAPMSDNTEPTPAMSAVDYEWHQARVYIENVLDDVAYDSTGAEVVARLRARGFRAPSEPGPLPTEVRRAGGAQVGDGSGT